MNNPWKMVPVEPTDEMRSEIPVGLNVAYIVRVYQSMLAAAPVPPAGDVEVLVDEDTLRDLSSSACQSALCDGINEEAFTRLARTVEQRCRASVTRLTAERDAALADVKALAEHRDELKMQRDRWVRMHGNLQSELTKARERNCKLESVLAECRYNFQSHNTETQLVSIIDQLLATTRTTPNADESCGQGVEAAKGERP